jgi:DeoR/GlpR family transcriptional regulator of sugar metabolism
VTASEDSPLAVERQRIIREILEREGVVRSAELKEILNVSIVTIRSDLRELEEAGICEVIWGGAVYKQASSQETTLLVQRSKLNPEAKRQIGMRAAQLVGNGQTVIVDAGTTTVEMVRHLSRDLEYLRIVTPALNIAAAASQFPNVELVMTGGVLRNLTRSLYGPQTVRALEIINADQIFLASGGYSIECGVTTSNMLEVEVKRTMVQRASRVVLLADSSKFGSVRPLTVVPMADVHMLITDAGMSDEDAQELQKLGIEVVRVPLDENSPN